MLATLTLLINPLILFLSASQLRRWNSAPSLSSTSISAIMALNLCGGMYAPPPLVFCIFCISAFRSIRGFTAADSPASSALARSRAICRSRSRRRVGSPSGRRGMEIAGRGGEMARARWEGGEGLREVEGLELGQEGQDLGLRGLQEVGCRSSGRKTRRFLLVPASGESSTGSCSGEISLRGGETLMLGRIGERRGTDDQGKVAK